MSPLLEVDRHEGRETRNKRILVGRGGSWIFSVWMIG